MSDSESISNISTSSVISLSSYSESDETKDENDPNQKYTIEKILKSRKFPDGKMRYYIKWRGYPSSYNSWEPIECFDDKSTIENFEEKQRKKRKKRERADKKKICLRLSQKRSMDVSLRSSKLVQSVVSDMPSGSGSVETSEKSATKHKPAPKCVKETPIGCRIKRVIAIYDNNSGQGTDDDFGFVCLTRDGSVVKISKTEGHQKYPLKVIKFYSSQVEWAPSTFKPTKGSKFSEIISSMIPKKPTNSG